MKPEEKTLTEDVISLVDLCQASIQRPSLLEILGEAFKPYIKANSPAGNEYCKGYSYYDKKIQNALR